MRKRTHPEPAHLLPLGALAAGFGLMLSTPLQAQTAGAPAPAASAPAGDATLPQIKVKAAAPVTDKETVRATSTGVAKGHQDIRDIPQSITVLTEKLLDDRHVDTLKQALRQTGGITFQAAEGGEEDIRLRGFSLATSGDIYVDGLRDPAFYDRDTFSYDRVEVLRGSASMLFGRGSTGGVVNQVQKQAFLNDATELSFSAGSGEYGRVTGDFNLKLGDTSALRINSMVTNADNWGNTINKEGLALNYRWGIGTDNEFTAAGYYLHNDNGINYGLPWLRFSSAQAVANPSGLIPGLNPKVYYGAASDYNAGGTSNGTLGWLHRFNGGGELKTTLRHGYYDRDQRASTIRFCTLNATTGANADCPAVAPGLDTISNATPLSRGTQNKVQNMHTTYLQSDYSNKFKWGGFEHEVLTGFELAHEQFEGYNTGNLPAGVVLDKNSPRLTVGSPNDGTGWVDESQRIKLQQSAFDAKSIGIYGQDLLQVAPEWKVLVGLRYDRFKGSYQSFQTSTAPVNGVAPPPLGSVTADRGRTDGLWSKRFGVLYQPTGQQTYYASYGTSFNTSGDTYLYDLPGSNTPPEASRNIEVGAKVDMFNGNLSTRVALFRTTKFNERNRDSPNGTPITDYLLSGRRHATGMDLDVAGRISARWEVFGSYTWIPSARIDAGNPNDNTALTGELVGQRPSMTPRHSGTVWTTYQFTDKLRLGAGLNARSKQTPNRNPAGIVAPGWVTGDLLAEYAFSDRVDLKLNLLNVTNKYYADSLYSGHYIQGAPRTLSGTLTMRF